MAPEGAICDIDIHRQRFVELVIKDGSKRREDALESLDAAAKVMAYFTTLKEGLLDLRVFPGRAFSHQGMVESEGFMVSMFAAPDHEALLSRLRCVS